MNIDTSSARITVKLQGAVPAFATHSKRVTCHLTRGYKFQNNTETITYAIEFDGSVRVSTTPSEFASWRFGFLQIHTLKTLSFFYAGPRKAPGRIGITCHKPPALSVHTHLDSDRAYAPWTNAKAGKLSGGTVTAEGGDHPASRAPQTLTNRATGKTNYLFHIVDLRKLVTALAARDPGGNFLVFAHIVWTLRYDLMFVWRNGTPKLHRNGSSLKIGTSTPGLPKNPAAAGILMLPAPPHANDEVRKAIRYAVVNNRPNRFDLDGNFANLPPLFFR